MVSDLSRAPEPLTSRAAPASPATIRRVEARYRSFWIPSSRGRAAEDGSLPSRPAEEVVAGPRPYGWWPRWWTVRRADGTVVRVIDEDIFELTVGPEQGLGEAIADYRESLLNMRVINVIAANVKWRRWHQLEELERALGGQRETRP
jgi:hypothetical protein